MQLAKRVIRSAKRPMSPRMILLEAYRAGIVPSSLYGKTQHKTLQARLSEDIVRLRDRSQFFRTAPGRFFLTEFLEDATVPEELRQPFPARRRFRELSRGPALGIAANSLHNVGNKKKPITTQKILDLLRHGSGCSSEPRVNSSNCVFIRSFVCVFRDNELLSYRLGRYRDDRDSFMSKRSIGFSSLVQIEEQTLFNIQDFGITDSGVRATVVDLDIPANHQEKHGGIDARLSHFVWSSQPSGQSDLLAVIVLRCPDWFEPTRRRLALNDLRWIKADAKPNNLDDFDPWSRSVIEVGSQNVGLAAVSLVTT